MTTVPTHQPDEITPFVLDLEANPHPRMLAQALLARKNARLAIRWRGRGVFDWRSYWDGYLKAMADATGAPPEALNAWLDRHEV